MIAHFYQNVILKNPKAIFVLLIIAILSFGYYSKNFRLDASSETLLTVSYTHLRAHETRHDLVCRLLLEKKN